MLKKSLTTLALAFSFGLTLGTYALADVASGYNPLFSWPALVLILAAVLIIGATIYNKRKKGRGGDE